MAIQTQHKSNRDPLRKDLRRILQLFIDGHRRSMTSGEIAAALGSRREGICRPLIKLETMGFIEQQRLGRFMSVRLTLDGRNYLRYHPQPATFCCDLSHIIDTTAYEDAKAKRTTHTVSEGAALTPGQDAIGPTVASSSPLEQRPRCKSDDRRDYPPTDHYKPTISLWDAMGARGIVTVSAEPRSFNGWNGKRVTVPGLMGRMSYARALKEIHKRKGTTSAFFCPAEVKLVCPRNPAEPMSKVFVRSQCLWMDLDIKRQPGGRPLPIRDRRQRLNKVLQRMVDDGLMINAIVDSGAGYHLYFCIQNYCRNPERMTQALRGLAKRYGGDIRAAHPTANLRIPGSTNIRFPDRKAKSGGRVVTPCRLVDLKLGERNTLDAIESIVGTPWVDPWWVKHRATVPSGSTTSQAKPRSYAASSKSKPFLVKDRWPLELFQARVRQGYVPPGKSHSEGDFALMAEAIKIGYDKQAIFGMFMDTENGICIKTRSGRRSRDERYLERTHAAALKAVKAQKGRAGPSNWHSSCGNSGL